MKKFTTFVASYIPIGGRTRLLVVSGIFYALSLLTIYGFATPCGALMRPLADKVYDNGKCGTVFYFPPQQTILTVMSYTEKIASSVKHSSAASTLFHETEALLKAADPQQAPQIILKMLQQLNGKVELHVHFVVNSVVVGNNISGSDIIISSYGHTSFGDNSSIDGQISKF
jgi:hypothetical protein